MASEKFSTRHGFVPRKLVQLDEIDDALRTRLLNAVIGATGFSAHSVLLEPGSHAIEAAWDAVMQRSAAERERMNNFLQLQELEAFFRKAEWYRIYDFVEVVVGYTGKPDRFSKVLEEENSGYRFMGGRLQPITSPVEVEEVESARQGRASSADHIQRALERYGDRKAPDFRNAIKEAISAVEAEVRLWSGDESAVLSKALSNCKDLHPALRRGIDSLYGYASDSGGIRHASGEGESEPSRDEARLMIVVCSAVVNFLRAHRAA
jgi:hypothetical protein